MSSVTISGLNKYSARLRSAAKKLQSGSDEVVRDAAEHGAALMREHIATRGTGYVGRGPRATPDGRIDYGVMYDAVGVTDVRHNPSGVAVNFGWVDGTIEDYFAYQEEGTRTVSPMHALMDATVETREYFYAAIKHMVKDL